MMSLQVIALCYILMMLAIPFTICLLMIIKESKVKEVKSQELSTKLLTKDQDIACVACHAVRQSVINGCHDLPRRELFVCFDCLKEKKAPIVGPFIVHPKTREAVSSDQYEYESALDRVASRVLDTFYIEHEETGMLGCQYPEDWEPCDGYWSDLYEKMLDRENARAAGCTVEQLCLCGYKAKNPDVGDGSRCGYCHERHEEYLATRNAISALEGAEVEVDWDEYEEEECTLPDGSCPECKAYSCAGTLCDECCSGESHEDETDSETTLQQEEEEECEEGEGEGDNQVTREQDEKNAFYADLEEEEEALWYQDIEKALSVSRKALIPKFSKRKTCFGKDSRNENGRIIKYQWGGRSDD